MTVGRPPRRPRARAAASPAWVRSRIRSRSNSANAARCGAKSDANHFGERFSGPVFLDFIKRLVGDAKGRKLVLIVDGHPAHRAKLVRTWVAEHAELIELHFLPGYSPELNPAECLNQDVKANALGRRRPRDLAQLVREIRAYLRSRQRTPALVARYFHERHVTYAAAPAH
jgi:transposase